VGELTSRVIIHAEIITGLVWTLEAISCSDTFIGRRRIAHRKESFPLDVMESGSGLGDLRIQLRIQEVIQPTRTMSRQRVDLHCSEG
jgi:hypothetical protein